MSKLNEFLVDANWNEKMDACYERDLLDVLYDRPMTVVEVFGRLDGKWGYVPWNDRVWVLEKVLRKHAGLPGFRPFRHEWACRTEAALSVAGVEGVPVYAKGAWLPFNWLRQLVEDRVDFDDRVRPVLCRVLGEMLGEIEEMEEATDARV